MSSSKLTENIAAQLALIEEKIERQKENCHINDDDDPNTIRQKDILFGKILGYEEVIDIIKRNLNKFDQKRQNSKMNKRRRLNTKKRF